MNKPRKNVFYAQSGGVSAVINATACAVIESARHHGLGTVYAGRNGIIGALTEDLIDTSRESADAIAALRHTPGGAFGTCRYKLPPPDEDMLPYERLLEVFARHDIGYFFYNGGGDSQDTVNKICRLAAEKNIPIRCLGIPKTVDNDLPMTDCCPGFGSAAKYIAVSVREAAMDVASMARTSTKVFILEVMGRHAGWLAAAGGLAGTDNEPPHIILFPERLFQADAFLKKVRAAVEEHGYCVIVAAEGVRDETGRFLAETGSQDAFGHAQLGGVAPVLAEMIKQRHGYKHHWAVADYLQRSARHIASATDVEQAYAVGWKAVEFAVAGENAIMPIIVRRSDSPYVWEVGKANLEEMANKEKMMPDEFIGRDGFSITEECRRYMSPLIAGEAYPPYGDDGLPRYVRLQNHSVPQKLDEYLL